MSDNELEGLWSIEFGVPSESTYGAGVIVFCNSELYGGDSTYYYIGKYQINENKKVTANIKIKHHYGPKDNVLGQGIGEVELNLSGLFKQNTFKVTDGKFMAVLTKREDLIS